MRHDLLLAIHVIDSSRLPQGRRRCRGSHARRSAYPVRLRHASPGHGAGDGPDGRAVRSTDELIESTARGILVTHFFYIRFLDQRTVLLTGLTRDGTFLIENGKVTRPLKNFRWNESPLFMLGKLDELGLAMRTDVGQVMPSLRARDFTFTSLSDAV